MKLTPLLPVLLTLLALPLLAADPKAKAPDVAKLDPAMGAGKAAAAELVWHDVTQWGVEGRAWSDAPRTRWFDRFPAAAQQTVTPAVWNLSRDSAGMMVRFRTNATAIHVHYRLMKDRLGMPHMPATGVSGVDLYARDDQGRWRWVQVTRPDKQELQVEIIRDLAPGEREYAAYLPLYNGVEFLRIGVPPGSKFEGLAPRARPVVFYGTSITHGACASRPGIVHPAILGRRLDVPVVNLGFSGNGRMDTAVGDYLTQVDAAAYVIDCLPNMNAAAVREKCVPLVRQLRKALGPGFPIIGVGGILTGEDAVAKIEAGADLVQVYTGLIYRGPALVEEAARALQRHAARARSA